MALNFGTNLSALNAKRQLNLTNQSVQNSLERLSSGLRINSAQDGPAGLSVREGLRAYLAALRASDQNAQQGSDLLQTTEGSLAQVSEILVRMRSLALQSSSSTLTDADVAAEISRLTRAQVLAQAGTSALAQANVQNQTVLQILLQ